MQAISYKNRDKKIRKSFLFFPVLLILFYFSTQNIGKGFSNSQQQPSRSNVPAPVKQQSDSAASLVDKDTLSILKPNSFPVNHIVIKKTLKNSNSLGRKEDSLYPSLVSGCNVSYSSADSVTDNSKTNVIPLSEELPPLVVGMINITNYYKGYKVKGNVSKTGKFTIGLAYDASKIPPGYTIADIRTYMFDSVTKAWITLEREKVDAENEMIFSTAPGDGEFINGIIKAPETPETFGYAPTTMKEMEPANPASMMQIIQPPVPNSKGSAQLSYLIETPIGRNGIQPNLTIAYSSDGGDGTLGEGWSLNLSKITVDTRWGVPLYDSLNETETYNLDGQMLGFYDGDNFILAHRNPDKPRDRSKPSRRFFLRKENAFNKIERYGKEPQDYYWIVTDKQGTKYYYGGVASKHSKSVLQDHEDIAEWYLRRVEDVYGNYMEYNYSLENDKVYSSNNFAKALYLDSVIYAGIINDQSTINYYRVIFQRQNKSNIGLEDNRISGRYGFLTHENYVYKNIRVDLIHKTSAHVPAPLEVVAIRSYSLDYKKGAFEKSLLSRITQFGANGIEFNHHNFEYYNEVKDGEYYQEPVVFKPGSDNLDNNMDLRFLKELDQPSELNNSISTSNSGNFYAGIGYNDQVYFKKSATFGVHGGFSKSSSSGLSGLIDINGDGIPDKVFTQNGRIVFRKGIARPNENKFELGEAKVVEADFNNFEEDESVSYNVGVQGNFYGFAGADYTKIHSRTTTYFSDVNADGLVDIVSEGIVYFNHLNNGIPTFTRESVDTPVALGNGDLKLLASDSDVAAEKKRMEKRQEELIEFNPLFDVVKVWEAPFAGTVNVRGAIKFNFIDTTGWRKKEKAEFKKADGVVCSIQVRGGDKYNEVEIKKNDPAPHPLGLDNVTVEKGDRIYFRVQSSNKEKGNGAFDRATWNPVIRYSEYNSGSSPKDAFNQNKFEYKSKGDHLFTNRAGISASNTGRLKITENFKKGKTNDSLVFEILRLTGIPKKVIIPKKERGIDPSDSIAVIFKAYDTTIVIRRRYLASETTQFLKDTVISVDSGAVLLFNVSTESNTDFSTVSWEPKLLLTAQNKEDASKLDTIMKTFVIPHFIFNDSVARNGKNFKCTKNKPYHLVPLLEFKRKQGATGSAMFVLRDNNDSVVGKQKLYYENGKLRKELEIPVKFGNDNPVYLSFENPRRDMLNDSLFILTKKVSYVVNYIDSCGAKIRTGGTGEWAVPADGRYLFTHQLKFRNPRDTNARVSYRLDTIIGQLKYNNTKTNLLKVDTLYLKKGDSVSIEYYNYDSQQYPEHVEIARVLVSKVLDADLYLKRKDAKFGPMYRGWGQFAYNGANKRCEDKIKENQLRISSGNIDQGTGDRLSEHVKNENNPSNDNRPIKTGPMDDFNPLKRAFCIMAPHITSTGRKLWIALDSSVQYYNDQFSASRFGLKDVSVKSQFLNENLEALTGGSNRAIAVDKSSTSESWSFNFGYSPAALTIGKGKSEIESDFMDINGDGYPDILGQKKVQLTNPTGKLGKSYNLNHNHASSSNNYGAGAGGTFPLSTSGATQYNSRTKTSPARELVMNSFNTNGENSKAEDNVGLNVSLGYGTDEAKTTWLDINGDGLQDKLVGDKFYLYLGKEEFSDEVSNDNIDKPSKGKVISLSPSVPFGFNIGNHSLTGGYGISYSHSFADFMFNDINGDGLVDKIEVKDGKIYAAINNGNSYSGSEVWKNLNLASIFESGFKIPSLHKEVKKILTDPIKDWNTNFNSSAGQSLGATFTFCFPIFCPLPVIKVAIGSGYNHSKSISRTNRQLQDVNGDGFSDLVESTEENQLMVSYSKIGKTNKLKAVSNSLNGTFTINYEHNEATYDHPGGKWVMSTVEVNDNIAEDRLDPKAKFDKKQSFAYENGNYDRYEREFLGFGKVTTSDLDYNEKPVRSLVSNYNVKNYYTGGNVMGAKICDKDNNTYSFKVYSYYLQVLGPVSSNNSIEDISENVKKWENRRFCSPVRYVVNGTNEGGNTTLYLNKSAFSYDNIGNVIEMRYKENPVEPDDINFDYKAQTSYTAPNPKRYIIGLPDTTRILGYMNQLLRLNVAAYDTLGRLVKKGKKVSDTGYQVIEYKYNGHGNLEHIMFPSSDNDDVIQTTYKYDDSLHIYIENTTRTETNKAAKHPSFTFNASTKFDYRFGLPLHHKDFNDHHINFFYDSYGRITKVISSVENDQDLKNSHIAANDRYTFVVEYGPLHATTRQYNGIKAEDITSISLVDGYGQIVQTKKKGVVDGDSKKWIVSGRIKHDALTRAVRNHYPTAMKYTDDKKLNAFDRKAEDPLFERISYDILDRSVCDSFPDGKLYSKKIYSKDAHNVIQKTIVFDNNGKVQQMNEVYNNGSGLVSMEVRHESADGSRPIRTKYYYDEIHQLMEVVNTNGTTVLSNSFDLAGRRKKFYHVNSGLIQFFYDNADNLTKKINANDEVVIYSYQYNRLIKMEYPNTHVNDVIYKYGTDNTGNTLGRLKTQVDATGAQTFEYDKMGNISKVVRTIIVPFDTTYTFETSFTYDSWNRLLKLDYTDESAVVYKYNQAGLLVTVCGYNSGHSAETHSPDYYYIDGITYDKFERKTSVEYNKGKAMLDLTYDIRRQLASMSLTGNKKQISTLNYTYDNIGNVASLTDTIPKLLPMTNAYKQTFSYDALGRLVNAKGNWNDPDSRRSKYQLDVTYNALNGITSRSLSLNSGTDTEIANKVTRTMYSGYKYDSTSWTLLKIISSDERKNNKQTTLKENTQQTFNYDNNGNNTYLSGGIITGKVLHDSVNSRQILWDEDNRVKAVNLNGSVSNYNYDANGVRTVKMTTDNAELYMNGSNGNHMNTPVNVAIYINPYITMRNGYGVYTKHIYVDGERIASQMTTNSRIDDRLEPNGNTENDQKGRPVVGKSEDNIDYISIKTNLDRRIENSYRVFDLPLPKFDRQLFSAFTSSLASPVKNPFIQDKGKLNTNVIDEKSQTYYYYSNHINNVNIVLNRDGEIAQHISYLPYGEIFMEQRQGYNSQYAFNAKEQDEETGLLYYGARYYDPATYQWLGVDPVAEKYPGLDPYSFCEGNPVKLIDPTGMAAVYSGESGELLFDDQENADVYIMGEGPELEYVGQNFTIQDVTERFNNQIEKTKEFFSQKNEEFKKSEMGIYNGYGKRYPFFVSQVATGKDYDIKQPGKGFSCGEIGKYSFYNGKLMRYDDYGNFNYGVAARAFGFYEQTAVSGAGLYQIWTGIKNGSFKDVHFDNMSGFMDNPRDTYMIRQGFRKPTSK